MRTAALLLLGTMTLGATGCGKTAPAPPSAPAPEAKPSVDKSRAQGVWQVTKLEHPKELHGNRLPSPQELPDFTVVVDGDRVTVRVKAEDVLHALLVGDTTKSPGRVEFVATEGKESREPRKGTVMSAKEGKPYVVATHVIPPLQGIYKFEGDTLLVALPFDPDAGRPSDFKPGALPRKEPLNGQSPVVVLHLKKK